MDDGGKQYLELAKTKNELLCEIRDISYASDLNAAPADDFDGEWAERYAVLYEEREALLLQISEIDEAMAEFSAEDFDSPGFKDEIGIINKEKDTGILDIIAFDTAGKANADKFANELKANIRNIRRGKTANIAYQPEMFADDGVYLDKKD